ncbi:MAG: hypothetical protein Q9227_007591 [Pyrenula ochraceoflavens]
MNDEMAVVRKRQAVNIALQQNLVHSQSSTCSPICTNSRAKKIDNVFLILEYVPAGTNLSFPYNDPSCATSNQLVSKDVCRVALSISTSNRSGITFEMWLPRNWTGRFLATGNGGIAGCIAYADIAYGSSNGFATVGANNGHNGTGGTAFLNNPDTVLDFTHRSLHTSVLTGKSLANAFYTQPHTRSYYIGCSLGGRQGIDSASRYPTDFDGVLAGSPALDFNNLYSWRASFYPITGPPTSPSFIPASTWKTLIHNEVLRQCDALDGVLDGIITDASLCSFRAEALLCSNTTTTSPSPTSNSSTCLTPAQVLTVQRIFSPLYGLNGTLIYPAMQPGSELNAATGLYSGAPWPYSVDWFRYAVYNNPSWDPATFNLTDAANAAAINPGDVRTWPTGELVPFRERGGKLITYHGGQDNQITSFDTPRWYDYVSLSLNSPSQQLDSWLRFFRVPGMFHCSGGPGAWVFGQSGGSASTGIEFEPSGNVLSALVEWVERNREPEMVVGTKFVGDEISGGVEGRREHCRYPARSTYVGGNASEVGSWVCR